MGLFSKKPKLDKFLVDESADVAKFTYEGKTYDLDAYVLAREIELRAKFNNDHIKATKNYKKAQEAYYANKNAISYIEYSIGKQLFNEVDKVKINALDVKSNS